MQPFGPEIIAMVDRPARTTAVAINDFLAGAGEVAFRGRPVVRWENRRRLLWVECVNWQAGEAVVRRVDDPCRSPGPVEGQQYLRIPSVARPSGSRSQRPVGGRDRDYETERR